MVWQPHDDISTTVPVAVLPSTRRHLNNVPPKNRKFFGQSRAVASAVPGEFRPQLGERSNSGGRALRHIRTKRTSSPLRRGLEEPELDEFGGKKGEEDVSRDHGKKIAGGRRSARSRGVGPLGAQARPHGCKFFQGGDSGPRDTGPTDDIIVVLFSGVVVVES